MKWINSEEEHSDFKNAVKGRRIILIWLTFSHSQILQSYWHVEEQNQFQSLSVFYLKNKTKTKTNVSENPLPSMGLKSILTECDKIKNSKTVYTADPLKLLCKKLF